MGGKKRVAEIWGVVVECGLAGNRQKGSGFPNSTRINGGQKSALHQSGLCFLEIVGLSFENEITQNMVLGYGGHVERYCSIYYNVEANQCYL